MPIFFLLFVVMPVMELALLIQVGSMIGLLNTVAIILLTAVIGVRLLKREGVATLTRFNHKLSHGELPAQEIVTGFALAAGGALLLTPGFVTDVIGFSLVIPFTRAWVAAWLLQRFQGHVQFGQFHATQSQHSARDANSETLEGEFTDESKKN